MADQISGDRSGRQLKAVSQFFLMLCAEHRTSRTPGGRLRLARCLRRRVLGALLPSLSRQHAPRSIFTEQHRRSSQAGDRLRIVACWWRFSPSAIFVAPGRSSTGRHSLAGRRPARLPLAMLSAPAPATADRSGSTTFSLAGVLAPSPVPGRGGRERVDDERHRRASSVLPLLHLLVDQHLRSLLIALAGADSPLGATGSRPTVAVRAADCRAADPAVLVSRRLSVYTGMPIIVGEPGAVEAWSPTISCAAAFSRARQWPVGWTSASRFLVSRRLAIAEPSVPLGHLYATSATHRRLLVIFYRPDLHRRRSSAPAVTPGGLTGPAADARGAIAGISGGALVWAYTCPC